MSGGRNREAELGAAMDAMRATDVATAMFLLTSPSAPETRVRLALGAMLSSVALQAYHAGIVPCWACLFAEPGDPCAVCAFTPGGAR